jgi:hypothetical protein
VLAQPPFSLSNFQFKLVQQEDKEQEG